MREARQAVAAMRASVATNSGTSAHFSDEWKRTLVVALCMRPSRAVTFGRARPQPRSTEHACRAYDISDGLLDSTARPCRGGGGARLRVIVVAGAQSHSHQSQIAVARRRRAAEVLLRYLRSVPLAGRCRGSDENHQACDGDLPCRRA